MPLLRRSEKCASGASDRQLVKDGEVLGPLEIATSRTQRTRGLLGRRGISGAMLLPKTRSVHTFGMRFGLDVAFLDDGNTVLRVISLPPNRVSGFCMHAHAALEAEAGALQEWGIGVGDSLEISEECV